MVVIRVLTVSGSGVSPPIVLTYRGSTADDGGTAVAAGWSGWSRSTTTDGRGPNLGAGGGPMWSALTVTSPLDRRSAVRRTLAGRSRRLPWPEPRRSQFDGGLGLVCVNVLLRGRKLTALCVAWSVVASLE